MKKVEGTFKLLDCALEEKFLTLPLQAHMTTYVLHCMHILHKWHPFPSLPLVMSSLLYLDDEPYVDIFKNFKKIKLDGLKKITCLKILHKKALKTINTMQHSTKTIS